MGKLSQEAHLDTAGRASEFTEAAESGFNCRWELTALELRTLKLKRAGART
jgi:hypothetical protein